MDSEGVLCLSSFFLQTVSGGKTSSINMSFKKLSSNLLYSLVPAIFLTSLITCGSLTLGTGETYSRFHGAGYWPVARAVLMMWVRGTVSSTATSFLNDDSDNDDDDDDDDDNDDNDDNDDDDNDNNDDSHWCTPARWQRPPARWTRC